MRDTRETQELEAQIARDKQKYSEVERLREGLLASIPPHGFSAISQELEYRGEMEVLEYSIRVAEEKLAGARSQPDWPGDDHRDSDDPVQVY